MMPAMMWNEKNMPPKYLGVVVKSRRTSFGSLQLAVFCSKSV